MWDCLGTMITIVQIQCLFSTSYLTRCARSYASGVFRIHAKSDNSARGAWWLSVLERRSLNREVLGSNPTDAVLNLGQVHLPHVALFSLGRF